MKLYYTEDEIIERYPDKYDSPYIQVLEPVPFEINMNAFVVVNINYKKVEIQRNNKTITYLWIIENHIDYVLDLFNIERYD